MKKYLIFIPLLVLACISSGTASGKTEETKPEGDPLPPLTENVKNILKIIGGEVLPNKNLKIGNVIIHRRENELSFPAKMCLNDSGEYGVEVLISLPHGRTYEALFVTETDPIYIELALTLIGAEKGARIPYPGLAKQGTLITIEVEPEDGERVPVENWLYHVIESEVPPPRSQWVYVGSPFQQGQSLAKIKGNIANVVIRGPTILDHASFFERGLGVNESLVPGRDTPVTIYFSIATKEDLEDEKK